MLGALIAIIFAIVNKFFSGTMSSTEPEWFQLVIAGVFTTMGWFSAGMFAAPKKVETKVILFILTIVLMLLVGINYDKATKKHECVIEKIKK